MPGVASQRRERITSRTRARYHRRRFIHTRGHPERNQRRRENPTLRDKAICMADAIAGKTKAVLGDRTFPMHRHTLKLENIFDELIPPGHWHLRTKDAAAFPIMGDTLPFKHRTLVRNYCANRDKSNTEQRWASTSLAFADQVHPLLNKSYWAAGRRALIAFDWIGHGRNRAKSTKLSHENTIKTGKCRLCGETDSQQHCMIDCTHPPFDLVRKEAKIEQAAIGRDLLETSKSSNRTHFIQQFLHASWTSSPQTVRIWLGLWTTDTLQLMLKQKLNAPISMQARTAYIKVIRKLTAPLLKAYRAMLDINNKCTAPEHPASTLLHPPSTTLPLSSTHRTLLENIHEQLPSANAECILNTLDSITSLSTFTISDAAFSLLNADGTT